MGPSERGWGPPVTGKHLHQKWSEASSDLLSRTRQRSGLRGQAQCGLHEASSAHNRASEKCHVSQFPVLMGHVCGLGRPPSFTKESSIIISALSV